MNLCRLPGRECPNSHPDPEEFRELCFERHLREFWRWVKLQQEVGRQGTPLSPAYPGQASPSLGCVHVPRILNSHVFMPDRPRGTRALAPTNKVSTPATPSRSPIWLVSPSLSCSGPPRAQGPMRIPQPTRLVLLRRRHKLISVAPGCRSFSTKHDAFKILFFGRDEFSCGVLRQVLKAKGPYVSTGLNDIAHSTRESQRSGRKSRS